MTASSADEFYCLMGELTSSIMQGSILEGDAMIKSIYGLGEFPFPQLHELREKYTYNIRPFTPASAASGQGSNQSKTRTSLRSLLHLKYSDEDDLDDDDITAMACMPGDVSGSSDISVLGPGVYGEGRGGGTPSSPGGPKGSEPPAMERMSTDIQSLKMQYERLKQRQQQAHIIIAAASAKKARPASQQQHRVDPGPTPLLVASIESPTAMNHLFVGKASTRAGGSTEGSSSSSTRNRLVTDGPRILGPGQWHRQGGSNCRLSTQLQAVAKAQAVSKSRRMRTGMSISNPQTCNDDESENGDRDGISSCNDVAKIALTGNQNLPYQNRVGNNDEHQQSSKATGGECNKTVENSSAAVCEDQTVTTFSGLPMTDKNSLCSSLKKQDEEEYSEIHCNISDYSGDKKCWLKLHSKMSPELISGGVDEEKIHDEDLNSFNDRSVHQQAVQENSNRDSDFNGTIVDEDSNNENVHKLKKSYVFESAQSINTSNGETSGSTSTQSSYLTLKHSVSELLENLPEDPCAKPTSLDLSFASNCKDSENDGELFTIKDNDSQTCLQQIEAQVSSTSDSAWSHTETASQTLCSVQSDSGVYLVSGNTGNIKTIESRNSLPHVEKDKDFKRSAAYETDHMGTRSFSPILNEDSGVDSSPSISPMVPENSKFGATSSSLSINFPEEEMILRVESETVQSPDDLLQESAYSLKSDKPIQNIRVTMTMGASGEMAYEAHSTYNEAEVKNLPNAKDGGEICVGFSPGSERKQHDNDDQAVPRNSLSDQQEIISAKDNNLQQTNVSGCEDIVARHVVSSSDRKEALGKDSSFTHNEHTTMQHQQSTVDTGQTQDAAAHPGSISNACLISSPSRQISNESMCSSESVSVLLEAVTRSSPVKDVGYVRSTSVIDTVPVAETVDIDLMQLMPDGAPSQNSTESEESENGSTKVKLEAKPERHKKPALDKKSQREAAKGVKPSGCEGKPAIHSLSTSKINHSAHQKANLNFSQKGGPSLASATAAHQPLTRRLSQPFNPFPVKHFNTNRVKAGLKLGLYTPSTLEQLRGLKSRTSSS
ncbi:TBC1 domain family member 30 [Plakobranchus ocellatus]|uniref:TBC1 domain family member 30 n=1 Tax=Plakobranchus ocellatus TaxID=259542 RepID=A0AAV3YMM2_9GAST|nr:TBC1 domain family member 30 [Plakobranchus ocellatus]